MDVELTLIVPQLYALNTTYTYLTTHDDHTQHS